MYRSRSTQGVPGHSAPPPPPPRPPRPPEHYAQDGGPGPTNPFHSMYTPDFPAHGPRHPALQQRPQTTYVQHQPHAAAYAPYAQQSPPPPPQFPLHHHRASFTPGAGSSSSPPPPPPQQFYQPLHYQQQHYQQQQQQQQQYEQQYYQHRPPPPPHTASPGHVDPAPPSYFPDSNQTHLAPTGDVKTRSDFDDSRQGGPHSQPSQDADDDSDEAEFARALAASAAEAQQSQQSSTDEDEELRRAIEESLAISAKPPSNVDPDRELRELLAATAAQGSSSSSGAWEEYDPNKFAFPRSVNDGIPGVRRSAAGAHLSNDQSVGSYEPLSDVASGKRPAHATFDTFTLSAADSDCMSMSEHSFESQAHSQDSFDSVEDRAAQNEAEIRMLREMQAEEEAFAAERARQMALDEELSRRLLEEEGLIPPGTGSMGGEEGEREIENAIDALWRRKLAAAGEVAQTQSVPEEGYEDGMGTMLPVYSPPQPSSSLANPAPPVLTASPSQQLNDLPVDQLPPGASPRNLPRLLPIPPGPPGPRPMSSVSAPTSPPVHRIQTPSLDGHSSDTHSHERHAIHHRASEPVAPTMATPTTVTRHSLPHSVSMPVLPTEPSLGPPPEGDEGIGRTVASPTGREKVRVSAVDTGPQPSGVAPLRLPGERGIMDNIAFGFSTPAMSYRLPPSPPMPDVIAIAASPSPAFHMQAPSWMALLKALAHMSDTKLEATPRTLEKLGGQTAQLRAVVQFVKAPLGESSWRTILYLSVDNPLPLNTPRPWRFTNIDTGRLPYKFPVPATAAGLASSSSLNLGSSITSAATLTNSPDAPMYAFAAPHAELPVSMPNVARFLMEKLVEARAAMTGSGSDAQSIRRLAKILDACYPEQKAERAPGQRRAALKAMIMGNRGKAKKNEPENDQVYQLVTPFRMDDWG